MGVWALNKGVMGQGCRWNFFVPMTETMVLREGLIQAGDQGMLKIQNEDD